MCRSARGLLGCVSPMTGLLARLHSCPPEASPSPPYETGAGRWSGARQGGEAGCVHSPLAWPWRLAAEGRRRLNLGDGRKGKFTRLATRSDRPSQETGEEGGLARMG